MTQPECWRIALHEPNRERLAIDGLLRIGIPSYHPTVPKRRIIGMGAARVTHKSMFPGYLLVKFSFDMPGWQRLFRTPGIRTSGGLMRQGEHYAELSEAQVNEISISERRAHGERNAAAKAMGLRRGDDVRIKVGPWADMLGRIEELDDDERIGVLIRLLGVEKRVVVPIAKLAV